MKTIFLSLALFFGSLAFAQNSIDTYPQEYNGDEYYDSSYDYPDDYYYNYPTDYYPDQYYQGNYNDYRQAVVSVNWNQFFAEYRLSPFQINQIINLNNRFASYTVWNSYYRYNPDRWYYDRFFALQNILGPRVFVVYQNLYFHGRSPFVFYKTRFVKYYAVHYPVRPIYRNVNINIYRVNRNDFRNDFRNSVRNNNSAHNPSPRSGANGNRDGNRVGGDRSGNISQNNIRVQPSPNVRSEGARNQREIRENKVPQRNVENRSNNESRQRNSAPRSERSNRDSGTRFTSR